MKVRVDREADVFYASWGQAKERRSKEIEPGVYLEYNERGEVIGMEVLFVSQRSGTGSFGDLHIELPEPAKAG